MIDNHETNDLSGQSGRNESSSDYLARAERACEAGDRVLGMHLYLAAYEKATADPGVSDAIAFASLREAWDLACSLKERSMAEYVFEKLEPYLNGDEIARCAHQLQTLALDRLEEYGFSREELESMAEMISQDFLEPGTSVFKVESISIPHVAVAEAESHDNEADEADEGTEPGKPKSPRHVGATLASPEFNPYDEFKTSSIGTSYHAATSEGSGAYTFTRDPDRAAESERARQQAAAAGNAVSASSEQDVALANDVASKRGETSAQEENAPSAVTLVKPSSPNEGMVPKAPSVPRKKADELPSMPQVASEQQAPLSYRTLSGYGDAIATMRELGIGLQRDSGFRNFVQMMNARHGLDRMPALDTLLFSCPVIEDATRFVDATVGEIGLPVLRMSMEEGIQGMPMLCVTTQGDARPRMNHAQNRFDGPSILVIDELDTWALPQPPENVEGIAGFVMANMSRGAREAINLIRSAVEDPDVFVLATMTAHAEVDPFFLELLEPVSIIEIEFPTERERGEIWNEIKRNHPSMRMVKRTDLVRYSAGLPRYDIYMAARAAIEDAYKQGLAHRMFMPITRENILDKLAAYQPLDSDEYRAIEEALVSSFREDLDDLSDLMGNTVE